MVSLMSVEEDDTQLSVSIFPSYLSSSHTHTLTYEYEHKMSEKLHGDGKEAGQASS